jgi:hypothetical protein
MPLTVRIPWKTVQYGYVEYSPAEGTTTEWLAVMQAAKKAEDAYLEVFGAPRPAQPPQNRPQQASRPQGGQRQGNSRADKYPLIPDLMCDICHGPAGRYPRTGNMRSDKAVCLNQCKDGEYVHTITWLDEDDTGDFPEPF